MFSTLELEVLGKEIEFLQQHVVIVWFVGGGGGGFFLLRSSVGYRNSDGWWPQAGSCFIGQLERVSSTFELTARKLLNEYYCIPSISFWGHGHLSTMGERV
jgi:hypothetical protein